MSDLAGMEWWNNLSKAQREQWMERAGNTGRAVDAWRAYLADKETLVERAVCPECFGTGFENHYLTSSHERECWKCGGAGEIYASTDLVIDSDH